MRIKRFVGRTLREATEQMRNDLGPDAVVLNSRNIPKEGQLSFLAKDMFELTAALDDVTPPRRNPYARRAAELPQTSSGATAGAEEDPVESLKMVARQFRQRTASEGPAPERSAGGGREDIAQLKNDLSEMRGTLSTVVEHLKYDRMPALPDKFQASPAAAVASLICLAIVAPVLGRPGVIFPCRRAMSSHFASWTERSCIWLRLDGPRRFFIVLLPGVGPDETHQGLAPFSSVRLRMVGPPCVHRLPHDQPVDCHCQVSGWMSKPGIARTGFSFALIAALIFFSSGAIHSLGTRLMSTSVAS